MFSVSWVATCDVARNGAAYIRTWIKTTLSSFMSLYSNCLRRGSRTCVQVCVCICVYVRHTILRTGGGSGHLHARNIFTHRLHLFFPHGGGVMMGWWLREGITFLQCLTYFRAQQHHKSDARPCSHCEARLASVLVERLQESPSVLGWNNSGGVIQCW